MQYRIHLHYEHGRWFPSVRRPDQGIVVVFHPYGYPSFAEARLVGSDLLRALLLRTARTAR